MVAYREAGHHRLFCPEGCITTDIPTVAFLISIVIHSQICYAKKSTSVLQASILTMVPTNEKTIQGKCNTHSRHRTISYGFRMVSYY